MAFYREILPPLHLRRAVECIWMAEEGEQARVQRVLPDGCADLIYTRMSTGAHLQVAGTMTRFADYLQATRSTFVGIRFRPGMWHESFAISGADLTDRILCAEDLWGKTARSLLRRLDKEERPQDWAASLVEFLPEPSEPSHLQQALLAIERSYGALQLDEAARMAGLSVRQFRRRCVEATGISPKMLARIVRFRRALHLARRRENTYADLAAESGYADQSHLIADFQEFAGFTPTACHR